jgi:hypothetical protein
MNKVVTLLLVTVVALSAFGCSRKKQQVQQPLSVSETLAQARAEREAQQKAAAQSGVPASKSSYIK